MEDDAQCELIIGIPAGGTFECLWHEKKMAILSMKRWFNGAKTEIQSYFDQNSFKSLYGEIATTKKHSLIQVVNNTQPNHRHQKIHMIHYAMVPTANKGSLWTKRDVNIYWKLWIWYMVATYIEKIHMIHYAMVHGGNIYWKLWKC